MHGSDFSGNGSSFDIAAAFFRSVSDTALAFGLLPAALQYFFAAAFGLAIGSFLTVVVHRLPVMMERAWRQEIADAMADDQPVDAADSQHHQTTRTNATDATDATEAYNLAVPRSACPGCGHRLRAHENIPLISYLLARGRCRNCGTAIGIMYPTLEALTMLLAMAILWHLGPGWHSVLAFGLGATLLALGFIDARTHLLPDSMTLPLLWAGLLVNVGGAFVPLSEAVTGAAAGYLFLWSVYWLFRLLRGKEGMGYGDFKLMGALGAWFGWHALPQLLLVSALCGSLIGIGALLTGRLNKDQPLPFGPYLAIAGLVTLFFGDMILQMG